MPQMHLHTVSDAHEFGRHLQRPKRLANPARVPLDIVLAQPIASVKGGHVSQHAPRVQSISME